MTKQELQNQIYNMSSLIDKREIELGDLHSELYELIDQRDNLIS